jgi:hypothetical protein
VVGSNNDRASFGFVVTTVREATARDNLVNIAEDVENTFVTFGQLKFADSAVVHHVYAAEKRKERTPCGRMPSIAVFLPAHASAIVEMDRVKASSTRLLSQQSH